MNFQMTHFTFNDFCDCDGVITVVKKKKKFPDRHSDRCYSGERERERERAFWITKFVVNLRHEEVELSV